MRRWLIGLGLAGLGLGSLLCAALPPPVATHRFDASPPPPFTGPLAPNRALAGCEILFPDAIVGPEELELDARGRVYAGTRSGEIVRVSFEGDSPALEVFARPGGQPNGLTLDRDGHLLVSDGYFVPASRIAPSGRAERVPWLRGADAAAASDGRVFFSEPAGETTGTLMLDVLLWIAAAAPEGRLLAHDPATGVTEILLDDLVWPDGVALSPDEDFVLVGEVSAYRIRRLWLAGPRAGRAEVFAENLPGFVDGLASNGDGTFTVAIPLLRNAVLDWLHRHPAIKDATTRLVQLGFVRERLLANPPGGSQGYGLVLILSADGRILRSFHDPATPLGPGITTAELRGETLYVGALGGRGLGRCPLPPESAGG